MIIYFCDRQLNILGHASTTLPSGIRITQDKTHEDVETGSNSFECTLAWDASTRAELQQAIVAGNYILKQGNGYDTLYQILETENDTKAQEINLYAEDAGLDLINTLCDPAFLRDKTLTQMLEYFLPQQWLVNVTDAPGGTKTYEWKDTETCTARIRSVAGLWDCELYYTFDVDGLQVTKRIVNVTQKRGLQEAIPQLRLNYDIDRILTQTSIADLVTVLNVTGATSGDNPITLVGYYYSYTDPDTGDVYRVNETTGQMQNITAMDRWGGVLDQDGKLVGEFSFDTTDQATLATEARTALQKLSYPAVNYEVDFTSLPDDARIGDRVNIIDDAGNLYLEARLLEIETSETDHTKTATIGEYLLKTSGISERVQALADELASLGEITASYTWVAYANDNLGTGISLDPTGKTYMGIAVNMDTPIVDITDPSVFDWVQMDSDSIVALSCEITSSEGTLFIVTTIDTVLTAHIYANGYELTPAQIADIGTIRWYDADNMGTVLGTGTTYTITQAMNISAINIKARLEVEV